MQSLRQALGRQRIELNLACVTWSDIRLSMTLVPLYIDTPRRPTDSIQHGVVRFDHDMDARHHATGPNITIGLVNNMPDSALEATERQFCNLLEAAAGSQRVNLRYYSLPEIPRGEAACARLAAAYRELPELWNSELDGLVVTGTEPRASDLRQEAYWSSLTALIDWSKTHVNSSVWSCLAAHAAVLHLDGVHRRPLAQKCSGVFDHTVELAHPLTYGLAASAPAPHSRWNEVSRAALESCGYTVLTHSDQAGVNLFAKQAGSLFLFWQGHPEYDERSLLKEYQRDVTRFLNGERTTYPGLPHGYFSASLTAQFTAFEARARAEPRPEYMADFPLQAALAQVASTWRPAAIECYRRWLQHIAESKSMRRSRRA